MPSTNFTWSILEYLDPFTAWEWLLSKVKDKLLSFVLTKEKKSILLKAMWWKQFKYFQILPTLFPWYLSVTHQRNRWKAKKKGNEYFSSKICKSVSLKLGNMWSWSHMKPSKPDHPKTKQEISMGLRKTVLLN